MALNKTCVVCGKSILGEYIVARIHEGRPAGSRNRWRTVGAVHERCEPLLEETMTDEASKRIEALLESIEKAERYKAGAWSKVIDYARKYAMVKSFGHYINDQGHREMLYPQDVETYKKQFCDAMCREAVIALSEDSMPRETNHG